MSWDVSDWEDYIVSDDRYWQQVYISITNHRNMAGAGKPEDMFVCETCLGMGTASKLVNCCSDKHLYSLAETSNNEIAKRCFIRGWVMHMIRSANKPKPKGTDKIITEDEALDYLRSLLQNIDSLIDEAIFLFEHNKYQRAGFLALVAKEEIVKMVWFSIENINREGVFFKFPIKGCRPGFTYRRLYLASRGLRLDYGSNESGYDMQFNLHPEYDMEDHDKKLKMAMNPSNFLIGHRGMQILSLDHFGKYYYLYRNEEQLIEYLRYVDIDFDHSQLNKPWTKMSREKAYDRILFAAALCHDWAEHGGYLGSNGRLLDPCKLREFRDRARKRFEDFLAQHSDIRGEVFPAPSLSEDEKQVLRQEINY